MSVTCACRSCLFPNRRVGSCAVPWCQPALSIRRSWRREQRGEANVVKEFREFAVKGNVVDLAVGVIIGGAFGKIVSSLVEDIVMPLVGALIGGFDFKSLLLQVGSAKITHGKFIPTFVSCFIIPLCTFLAV